MFLKNKKGFNLFTALISLMLISIVIVFIYNMVQTEENYLSLINDQSKTSDLITIADLSRADAFNIFVVSFRDEYINFRNNYSNEIVINRNSVVLPWPDFIDYFADEIFFDNRFSSYFASHVVSGLRYTNPPAGYAISISDYNSLKLEENIRQAFEDALERITVVGCEIDSHNCLGSLYFTIDTRNLSDDDYEQMPMIIVKRNQDDEVVQRPVFARREYKIYMPWRAFQGMRTVRNYALSYNLEKESEKEDIVNGLANSRGFFNINLYNALNSAKLGVCDINSCDLRTSLFKTVDKTGFVNYTCDQPPTTELSSEPGIITGAGEVNISVSHDYNLSSSDLRPIFKDLVETTVKNNLDLRAGETLFAGDDLVTVASGLGCNDSIVVGDFKICEINVVSSTYQTKNITATLIGNPPISNLAPSTFNTLRYNSAWNVGLFKNAENDFILVDDTSNHGNHPLNCSKIIKLSQVFKFEEQNEKYLVNPDVNYNIYIRLEDSFPRYSFFDPSSSISMSGGYFQSLIYTSNTSSGWSCTSYSPQGVTGGGCVAN